MRGLFSLARRALLAALILAPLSASSEIAARLHQDTGDLFVSGLSDDTRTLLVSDDSLTHLQVDGLGAARGMLLTLEDVDGHLRIVPRFELQSGTAYVLSLDLAGQTHRFNILAPAPDVTIPTLIAFTPSQAVIPENTLRVYLHFSEPMARGQLRDVVRLFEGDGTEVVSPFLTLGPELWDNSQTRVTLLFDPGRIKQGVGPNAEVGPPLEEGRTYRLVVSGEMESALGNILGQEVSVSFRVGPAERRPIDPADWQVLAPPAASPAPLTIAFDRILDSAAVARLLVLRDPFGDVVPGFVETDGGGWSITPEEPWDLGTYSLVIDPALEDVSGNRPSIAFDAEAGSIGRDEATIILPINITR